MPVRCRWNLDPVPAPRVDGRLVVQCGEPAQGLELFAWQDGELQQLTVDGGIDSVGAFSVRGASIALSRDSGFDGAKIGLTQLGSVPLRGHRSSLGQMVALGPDGRVASTRLREHSSGLLWDAIYVRREGSTSRRIAEFRSVWGQQYVGRQLTALVSDGHQLSIARDVGTGRQRLHELRTDRPNGVVHAISRTARVAYPTGRQRDRRL